MEDNLEESDSSSQKLPSSEAALAFLVDFLKQRVWRREGWRTRIVGTWECGGVILTLQSGP